MLPNFIGIGAQRAGTTWIHNCLREHPEAFVPEAKELHFFDSYFDRGVEWYREQLSGGIGRKAVGEITPNYLDAPKALSRMAQFVPDAKLFVVLRNPADRAFSAFQLFRARYGDLSFRQACQRDPYLLDLGRYGKLIERVYRFYPPERVKVLLYDTLETRPKRFLSELFGYLGIDSSFQPSCKERRYNRMIYPRTQACLRAFGMHWAIDRVRHTTLGDWIRRRHSSTSESGHLLLPNDRDYLREFYRDDILHLQNLLNLDLHHWLERSPSISVQPAAA